MPNEVTRVRLLKPIKVVDCDALVASGHIFEFDADQARALVEDGRAAVIEESELNAADAPSVVFVPRTK